MKHLRRKQKIEQASKNILLLHDHDDSTQFVHIAFTAPVEPQGMIGLLFQFLSLSQCRWNKMYDEHCARTIQTNERVVVCDVNVP